MRSRRGCATSSSRLPSRARAVPATTDELNAARSVIIDAGVPAQAAKANKSYGYASGFFTLLTISTRCSPCSSSGSRTQPTPRRRSTCCESGQANNAFVGAIVATKTKIDISPRYGTWDPKTLGVTSVAKDPAAGAPPFVHFGKS